MGVCHIVSGDRWAGAEVQVAALLSCLARDPRFQLSAILLNPGRLAETVKGLGVPARVIPESQNNFWAIVRQASDFLRTRNVQILHSHRYKEHLVSAVVARQRGIPFMVETVHGLQEPQSGWRFFRHSLILQLDRWLARRIADRVICVSPEIAAKLRPLVPNSRLVTILNGVEADSVRTTLTREEAKVRLGIAPHHAVLGAVGRLEPVKKLDHFLRAAAEVLAVHPSCSFVLAGEGNERERLERLSRNLGMHDRAYFLGHRNDIYDVMRAMDMLVMPSEHEGLPMVLLEALSLGVAVVARDVGGIPEVIRDGETGVLVRSGDAGSLAAACLRVLKDEALRRKLAEAGARHVRENFSAERNADQVAQLYRNLTGAR